MLINDIAGKYQDYPRNTNSRSQPPPGRRETSPTPTFTSSYLKF